MADLILKRFDPSIDHRLRRPTRFQKDDYVATPIFSSACSTDVETRWQVMHVIQVSASTCDLNTHYIYMLSDLGGPEKARFKVAGPEQICRAGQPKFAVGTKAVWYDSEVERMNGDVVWKVNRVQEFTVDDGLVYDLVSTARPRWAYHRAGTDFGSLPETELVVVEDRDEEGKGEGGEGFFGTPEEWKPK